MVQFAVHDYAASDPGSDGDADRVASPPSRAHPPFAQHGAIGIVVERGRKPQALVDDLAERQIDPAQVRGEQHDAPLGVERTWRSHPDADDVSPSDFLPGSFDGSLGQGDEPVEHIALARLRMGRFAVQRVQGRAILGHAAHDEIGSAYINSEDKSHADSSALTIVAIASSTASTDRSRMHRWWPRGQRGDHDSSRAGSVSPACPSVTSPARRGPKSKLGHRRAEQRDNRRAHRGSEVQRSGIVGDQHRRTLNQRGRLPEAQRTRRIHYPVRRRRRDRVGQRHVVGAAHDHHHPVESGGELGDNRASAWFPRSSLAPAPRTWRPRHG